MKKMIVLLILVVISGSLLVPLFAASTAAQTGDVDVVCTNSILADFATRLLGDNAAVEYIMPAGACPTHFDTSPSDVVLIGSADIVISLGWEPWLSGLLSASGNDDAVEIKCMGLGEWNIPEGAKKYVDKIASGLGAALPALNSTIQTNAVTYKDEIDAKATQLQDLVETSGYVGKQVACMEWQKSFVEWLGFEVVSYYAPPESLSTADVLNVTTTIQDNDVVAIVDNLQSGTDFGANIASGTGITHVIFTNFPGAIPNTDTYLEMIDYNTNQLIDGITAHEQQSEEIASLNDEVSTLELQRTVLLTTTIIFATLAGVAGILYKRKGQD